MHPLYDGKSPPPPSRKQRDRPPLHLVCRQFFFVIPPIVCPLQFFVDAPFGRFAPPSNTFLVVDGIRAWILMEIVSPIAFIYSLANTPLATSPADTAPLIPAQLFLASLFLVHYANRALISPLRTPSRSKAHISVTLSGIAFNIINGILMGTYLRSHTAHTFLADAVARPAFWAGTALWAIGLFGNIFHDEVLLNIRRNAKAKGKAKAKSDDDPHAKHKEYYGIPHGYLYTYVSYPNYLCEWVEWFGFALAAAPPPALTSLGALVSSVQPPWIFFFSEISLMIARAYRGHRWYLANFPDYPKDRKVVIPLVF
ncbi:3-oxo-5-alpha-steroid 4-dehydrogenase-domain-containing protein [Butyriboletus roseoflavus]|nr:3-oxo-5-alpha-steroid 4-dehydrogenase-domain-containing protein [Butyriboletus roseoflavus]